MTAYLGDKLPAFYIGSTSVRRLNEENYHGSPRSQKYQKTWEEEIKNNPDLFETTMLETFETRDDALIAETALQRLFDAVKSPHFVNKAYARSRFFNTPEFAARARATRERKKDSNAPKEKTVQERKNERHAKTLLRQAERAAEKARARKIIESQKPIKPPKVYKTKKEIGSNISAALKGHTVTEETRNKIGAKNSIAHKGKKQSADHVLKRAASRKATMESRPKSEHSPERRAQISASLKRTAKLKKEAKAEKQ